RHPQEPPQARPARRRQRVVRRPRRPEGGSMKVKGTLIQGALAVVGLGAAYATWQREPEKAAGEVVVLDATKADIARVRFEDDKGFVELRRGEKSESAEPTAWVKISAREERGPKGVTT